MKMGADPADRMYEEFTSQTKLKQVLCDVRHDSILCPISSEKDICEMRKFF